MIMDTDPVLENFLEELFRGWGYDIQSMTQRMSALMAEENLAYGNRSHTYNSRLAQ